MVLAYWGIPAPRHEIRAALSRPGLGTTAWELREAGRRFALDSEGFQVGASDLAQLPTPAILHWSSGHFVVLEGMLNGNARIVDPASGRRWVRRAELLSEYSGTALGFELPSASPASTSATRSTAVRELGASLLAGFAVLAVAEATGWMLAVSRGVRVIDANGTATPGIALELALIFALLATLAGIARRRLDSRFWRESAQALAARVGARLLEIDTRTVESISARDLEQRIADVDEAASGRTPLPGNVLMGVGSLVLTSRVLVLWWQLGLAIVGFLCVLATVRWSATRVAARITRETRSVRFRVWESLRGISVAVADARAGGRHDTALKEWLGSRRVVLKHAADSDSRMQRVLTDVDRHVFAACYATLVLLILVGVGSSVPFHARAEALALAIAAVHAGRISLREVESIPSWRRRRDRLEHLLEGHSRVSVSAPSVSGMRSRVNLAKESLLVSDHLYSHAAAGQAPTVRDLCFSMKRDSHACLLAPQGAGKTTLARLLLGVDPPASGAVFIDGRNVLSLCGDARRSLLNGVLDGGRLREGTIEAFLRAGDPGIDGDRLRTVSACVGLESWLRDLPLGMRTPIVNEGRSFPSTVRSLLVLARALVVQPKLLVLDGVFEAFEAERAVATVERVAELGCSIVLLTARAELCPASWERRWVMVDAPADHAPSPR
jgi:ATP-binding cassette subfamily B protein RaxB